MFILRGIAVSLMFFILLYCLLSMAVIFAWRGVNLLRTTSRRRADWLFWLRVAPLLASAAVMLVLVVPAYVRLEPRSIEEDMALPVVLALGCLSLFGVGFFRVVNAQKKSSRVVADWMDGADSLDAGIPAPIFQARRQAPPLTLVGVCSPRVVVSETTVTLLDKDELRVAVQHEMAHMRFHDNLKKLAFYCSPFPVMTDLESAWGEAAELAADEEAVTNVHEALDLAAALIKLSRLTPVIAGPAFTMGLLSGDKSLVERVERLLNWRDNKSRAPRARWGYTFPAAFGAALIAVAANPPALAQIHRLTEWLVR